MSDERSSRALAVRGPSQPQVWDDVPLQKLWLATQRRDWRSLALVAASPDVDTLPIAELLAHAAWAYSGRPSCVFDLRDLGLRLAEFQMREIGSQIQAGSRVVIALRSTGENPTAVPIARKVDATVLCIALGGTRIAAAERAIQEIGREQVIGSIVVRAGASQSGKSGKNDKGGKDGGK